jgi:hypothetical protein
MPYTITVTIERPNTNVDFWYDAEYYQTSRLEVIKMFDEAVFITQTIIDFNKDMLSNQLKLTRITVFKDEESKNIFMTEFENKFTDYVLNRQTYCSDNGHVLTITEG